MPSLPSTTLALIPCLSLFPCGLWADRDPYDPTSSLRCVALVESMQNVCRRYAVEGSLCAGPSGTSSGFVHLVEKEANTYTVERAEVERAFKTYLEILSDCGVTVHRETAIMSIRLDGAWQAPGPPLPGLTAEESACVTAGLSRQAFHPEVDGLTLQVLDPE